jgi:hypothetical protein
MLYKLDTEEYNGFDLKRTFFNRETDENAENYPQGFRVV